MLEDLKLLGVIFAAVCLIFLMIGLLKSRLMRKKTHLDFEETFLETPNANPKLKLKRELPLEREPHQIPSPKRKTEKRLYEKVIALSLISRNTEGMNGQQVLSLLNKQEFIFGEDQLFHKHTNDDVDRPILFSLAQSTASGEFDIDHMRHQRIRGLIFYMNLPVESQAPLEAFDHMLTTVRQLAAQLNGEICDKYYESLTTETLSHYRESIKQAHQTKSSHMA